MSEEDREKKLVKKHIFKQKQDMETLSKVRSM